MGQSGEYGCLQYMPNTWKSFSRQILGYVPPQTVDNEMYVAAHKIQGWLNQGKTESQIALAWNAGEKATKCSRGKNKHGVKFDSCNYVASINKM